MALSHLIGWETGAIARGNDRFETTAESVGLSLVLAGGVEVEWSSRGCRKALFFATGMSDLRPADGEHHRYDNRWLPHSLAFCLTIPPELFEIVADEEGIGGGSPPERHRFGFHDPVVETCMRRLCGAEASGLETPDIESWGRRLLVRLLDVEGATGVRRRGRYPTLRPATVRHVRDFIDANLAERISLGALARLAGLSPGHFGRAFRRKTGTTPGHYLRVRRVAAAFHHLASTGDPLAVVARTSGFSSQSHMTRAFAAVTGFTPGYARRRRLRPRWPVLPGPRPS